MESQMKRRLSYCKSRRPDLTRIRKSAQVVKQRDSVLRMSTKASIAVITLAFIVSIGGARQSWAHKTPAGAKASIAAIAVRICVAWRHSEVPPRELFADRIEITHVPEQPGDPVMLDKDAYLAGQAEALRALKKALKDFHIDVTSTEASPNTFALELVDTGTRTSGNKVFVRISIQYVVTNGVVTALKGGFQDSAERDTLMEVLKDGGYGIKH
jgi:hypothetical protein